MKLWINTDAGIDDATAILIALNAPDVDVIGISCVGGNTSLENVVKNVNRTLQVYGKGKENIPIYKGCEKAIIAPKMHIPNIHGSDGLGDIKNEDYGINKPFHCESENAIQALFNAIDKYEDLCVLELAPLTNLALALRVCPEKFLKIKHLYIMGGAEDGKGNATPHAEFNFRCDPEAAHIIFSDFPQNKITLITWTLTLKHKFAGDKVDSIARMGDTILQRFTRDTWKGNIVFNNGYLLTADPLAAFIACYKGVIKAEEKMEIKIERFGDHIGESYATPSVNGCSVVQEVDSVFYENTIKELLNDH